MSQDAQILRALGKSLLTKRVLDVVLLPLAFLYSLLVNSQFLLIVLIFISIFCESGIGLFAYQYKERIKKRRVI
jgi:hypothetical protein